MHSRQHIHGLSFNIRILDASYAETDCIMSLHLTDLLRYLITALATMFSSRTEVPPRLFTTRATLSPTTCEKQNQVVQNINSNIADYNKFNGLLK